MKGIITFFIAAIIGWLSGYVWDNDYGGSCGWMIIAAMWCVYGIIMAYIEYDK